MIEQTFIDVADLFDVERNHTFGHSRVQPLLAFRDMVLAATPADLQKSASYFAAGIKGRPDEASYQDHICREGALALEPEHVSAYALTIEAGTPLDVEAARRGTSIYYPGKVIPMLPEALSLKLPRRRTASPRTTLTGTTRRAG